MKRVFILLLAALLCLGPAAAAQTPPAAVDASFYMSMYYNDPIGVIALYSDGTVAAAGVPDKAAAALREWRGIRQLRLWNGLAVGLRQDGTLAVLEVSESSEYVDEGRTQTLTTLSRWYDLQAITCSSHHFFGLKKDGTLLVTALGDWPGFGADPTVRFDNWTNLRQVVGGSCSSGEFVVAIRKDGTILEEGLSDRVWFGTPKHVKDVSCSGWVLLCLQDDGTVCTTGGDAMPDILEWRDMVQVCAGDMLSLGLRADGTIAVASPIYSYETAPSVDRYEEVKNWRDIRRLSVIGDNIIFGITKDGHVRTNSDSLKEAVRAWTDVERVLAARSDAVIALRRDGTLLTYGCIAP